MSPQAERVWTASNDYVVMAQTFLEPADDRYSEGSPLWKKEEYRVNFLFPNQPERTRLDLCKVRCRFLGVEAAQRAEREQSSQGSASGAEHQEADAVSFQKDAQDACARFSPIQQEILREKFFVQFKL
jgi:hypothetical protein